MKFQDNSHKPYALWTQR